MQSIGLTLHTLGEILIGYMVIVSHYRLIKEHRVDDRVLKTMKLEITLGGLGLALIVVGYAFEVSAQRGWI